MKLFTKIFGIIACFFAVGSWCAQASGMALIKTTAIVDAISGSVRGTVFAKNKGGAYIRGKGLVSNPQTQKQSGVRSIFSSISQTWRSLTSQQRSAWNSAVSDYPYQNRLGETKQLSGFALHQKLNLNLLNIGQSMIAAPLAPALVQGLESLDAIVSVAGPNLFTVTSPDLTPDADTSYLIFATPSVSAGVTNVNKLFRLIGTVDGASLQAGADVTTDYTDVFGVPSEGEKVGFKAVPVNINTGQNGAEVKDIVIVTA